MSQLIPTMKTTLRIIHWIPRILCMLAILFISMFALDSFVPGMALWQQVSAFMIHLIPSFVLVLFLVIAWRWELAGGTLFMITGFGFMPFIYMMNFHMNHSVWLSLEAILVINVPFILVGILFILSRFLKSKNSGN